MLKIQSLEGAHIAIVALGNSQVDFAIGKENSVEWDEVWTINSAAAVYKSDRMFMLDPASRFFDSDDAGSQTEVMKRFLPECDIPCYTSDLDPRVPSAVLYPVKQIVKDTKCAYLNNTIPMTIAFAYWHKVARIDLFGIDYTYKHSLHFAEAGRACTEFWLAKCMDAKIQIGVSHRSTLLDHNVPIEERIYGFHRLKDPILAVPNEPEWIVCEQSKIEEEMERAGVQMPEEIRSPEPYRG
jgi:hypothetical protein